MADPLVVSDPLEDPLVEAEVLDPHLVAVPAQAQVVDQLVAGMEDMVAEVVEVEDMVAEEVEVEAEAQGALQAHQVFHQPSCGQSSRTHRCTRLYVAMSTGQVGTHTSWLTSVRRD